MTSFDHPEFAWLKDYEIFEGVVLSLAKRWDVCLCRNGVKFEVRNIRPCHEEVGLFEIEVDEPEITRIASTFGERARVQGDPFAVRMTWLVNGYFTGQPKIRWHSHDGFDIVRVLRPKKKETK